MQLPLKTYLLYEEFGGDHRFMPAYVGALGVAGVKVVNTHPENRRIYHLPTVGGLVLLLSPRTGEVLAIMEATWITAVKTAAASAVATRYLARSKSERLCLIGAGLQAIAHIMALSKVMNIREVRLWSRTPATAQKFAEQSKEHTAGAKVVVAEEAGEAVQDSDVIATLTPSRQPIVLESWVKAGTHINAMGADAAGKQEIDPKILMKAKVVVDDVEHSSKSGEINVPMTDNLFSREGIYGEIGEICLGTKPGRTSENEITVFASTGIAIQDIAVAEMVYRRAVKLGIGSKIDLAGPTLELI